MVRCGAVRCGVNVTVLVLRILRTVRSLQCGAVLFRASSYGAARHGKTAPHRTVPQKKTQREKTCLFLFCFVLFCLVCSFYGIFHCLEACTYPLQLQCLFLSIDTRWKIDPGIGCAGVLGVGCRCIRNALKIKGTVSSSLYVCI